MNVTVTELSAFTLLHVATRGAAGEAAKRLTATLGVGVAAAPGSASLCEDGLAVLWFGAGRWLVHAPAPGFRMDAVDGCTVTELTASRRIFRLAGDGVTDYLSSSCPLDFRERAMPAGSAALSHFDRFPILLHRRAADAFDVFVERSYAPALGLPRT